jgi:hypothetical protein
LRKLARLYGSRILVETGTYYGETLKALHSTFAELHSIELSAEFFRQARERFGGDSKIHLWQGDSGDVLPDVLKVLNKPALFWLDGHYSGGPTALGSEVTPIMRELRAIAQHPLQAAHIVVVDDARLFNGEGGYPTLEELQAEATRLGFRQIDIKNDMILLSASAH